SAGTTEESQSGGTSAGTTEEPQSSGAPSAGATEEPQSSASSAEETVSSKLTVKKLRASVNANCSVTLSWSKNANAKKYQLYRSTGKKYTRIATIKGKTKYTDKEAPKGKKVYYRLRAVGSNTSLSGNYSKVVKAKVLWLRTPTIQVSKGETSLGKASVAVRLKKYDGTYAEIYVSQDGKKYVKIPLKSGTIKSFKKVYRLTYSYKKFQKQTLYFKVRTYKMHGTEKRKSSFSKVKRIVL
ncbi:MAG: hypothetical protein LUH14_06865, partial [Clostridiaceae bacterium]|nr:hypothetical protein [Clostridiaceae bacterium]